MLGAMIAPMVVLHIDERMKPVHRRGERHYMNAVDILHAFNVATNVQERTLHPSTRHFNIICTSAADRPSAYATMGQLSTSAAVAPLT
jgi:hypothetical protein